MNREMVVTLLLVVPTQGSTQGDDKMKRLNIERKDPTFRFELN